MSSESNVVGLGSTRVESIQAPSVLYQSLRNDVFDPGVADILQGMDEKDLFVLQSLLNQALSNVHREMARRNTQAGYSPQPW